MIWRETAISGVFLVDPEPASDDRGAFWRSWCGSEAAARGLPAGFAQISVSENIAKGTIRGLHVQRPPHAEEKFIRVTAGAIWDVVVDLRPSSPTYGRSIGAELSAANRRAIYVPAACAHGFQTLNDNTALLYHITAAFAPGAQDGIRYDDPDLAIAWPLGKPTRISARDEALPRLRDFLPMESAC